MIEETQPLLQGLQRDIIVDDRQVVSDILIVDFDQDEDPENPIQWPPAYKWGVVALLAFMAFTVTFTCISVVPVANVIVRDLNHSDQTDKSASVLLVTIWELGEAAGPLAIGPLSEILGRRRVLIAFNGLFILTTIFAACCRNTHLFITARFLTGVAVVSNVLNPAIVGDIYLPEERGSAMSLIMLAPLIGGALGPGIAGSIQESLGWRSILWISAALATACQIVFVCCFRETYKVVILRRKAVRLSLELDDKNIKTIYDVESSGKASTDLLSSITRPFQVLFGSGVLISVAVYGGLTFTYFYIMSTSLPDILDELYGLSPTLTGFCFISYSVGSVVSVILCNLTLDKVYIRLKEANRGIGYPEYRLPLVIVGSIALPISIAIYGWVASLRLPLAVLLVANGFMGAALMLGYLPVMAYVVDALGLYSASGMTAIIVTRCLMGTFFPLTTAPLIRKLGYGWAFTVLGGISLAFAPIPMLIYRYGSKWRMLSKYTNGT